MVRACRQLGSTPSMTREQNLDNLIEQSGQDPTGGESTITEVLEGYAQGGFTSSFIVTDECELNVSSARM